jgi:hypothetical protein
MFIAGNNIGNNLSPETTTPANHLSPESTTPAIKLLDEYHSAYT